MDNFKNLKHEESNTQCLLEMILCRKCAPQEHMRLILRKEM